MAWYCPFGFCLLYLFNFNIADMKKKLAVTLILFVFTGIFYLTNIIYKKIQKKESTEKNISALPFFSFLAIDSKLFSNASIKDSTGKIIINFFNPECEHCQYMAKTYVRNTDKFRDITLLMITIADSASLAKFKADYHLDSISNLVLLRDPTFQFEKIFGSSVVPSFFVYKDRKLVKKIIGETKIENLLD